jgi:6,7-dimethyl-8-ribityllumazine synthase
MRSPLDPKLVGGSLHAEGLRFGIVASRFNSFITDRLLRGVLDALETAGVTVDQLETLRVPGSFEIPLAVKQLAATGRVHATIAIGCVLRGETSHYDYVCSEVARGVQLAQMDTGVPCIFCVLTCDTLEQAIDRAGSKGGNKGYDAGLAAVEMATLARRLSKSAPESAGRSSAALSKPVLLKSSKQSLQSRSRRSRGH